MEIVLIFLLFFSGIAAIILTRNIYLAIVSCRWQVVQATVIGVGSEKTSDGDFYPRYIQQIRYTYSINDVVYYKKRYEFGKKCHTKNELDSILKDFTIGEKKIFELTPGILSNQSLCQVPIWWILSSWEDVCFSFILVFTVI